jgi:hypothetical protein
VKSIALLKDFADKFLPFLGYVVPDTFLSSGFFCQLLRLVTSYYPSPVLYEEIGQGASGASVRRCKFGELTAAAKVFTFPYHLIMKFSTFLITTLYLVSILFPMIRESLFCSRFYNLLRFQ